MATAKPRAVVEEELAAAFPVGKGDAGPVVTKAKEFVATVAALLAAAPEGEADKSARHAVHDGHEDDGGGQCTHDALTFAAASRRSILSRFFAAASTPGCVLLTTPWYSATAARRDSARAG